VVTWTVMPWSLGRSIRGHLDAQLTAVWPPGANGLARIWLWPGIARELWLLAPRFWLASDAAGIRFRAARRERELLDLVARTGFVPATEVPPGPGKTALEERLMRLGWAVRVTRRNVRLCYANLIAQAALLAVSLAALAYSRDFVPPWLAIIVAVGGVGLLA
jgi:hypothetical protein